MGNKPPTGIIVCGALIFIASFLTWGVFQLTPPGVDLPPEFAEMMKQMTVSINGWRGHLTLMGVQLPNWLAVVAFSP